MRKTKVGLFLLVIICLFFAENAVHAEELPIPGLKIVTESPLEVTKKEKFAVTVEFTFATGNEELFKDVQSIELVGLSASGKTIVEGDAPFTNLSDGTRKVVLYGKINEAGPVDITQIKIIYNGDKSLFRIRPVDALLIEVKEPESKSDAKTEVLYTPRVFLQNYTLSQSNILAGDTFTLTLYVQNTSTREVRNLKISLATIPAEDGTSGTVFSPVNSSNSFYVEKIGPKSTYTKSINIFVDPNATAKTYLVPVEILYEDDRGESYSVSEMVNIPVLQESRLQVLGVEVPPTAIVGEATPVTAEFVNVGKVALKNVLVTVEGEFPKENASYFLANFEIGQSDFYQAYIIPEAEGLLEGKVTFRYLDYTNQEVVEEYPFSIEVMAGLADPGLPVEPLPENPPSAAPRFLYILGPALLLALIIAGIVFWRRRKAKQGEIFDEEL